MADSPDRKYSQPIWYELADFATPYVHETVGYKVQPVKIARECAAQLIPRWLVHPQVHVDIEFSEILKGNERIPAEYCRRVTAQPAAFGRSTKELLDVLTASSDGFALKGDRGLVFYPARSEGYLPTFKLSDFDEAPPSAVRMRALNINFKSSSLAKGVGDDLEAATLP
jgi:hypothetical protein